MRFARLMNATQVRRAAFSSHAGTTHFVLNAVGLDRPGIISDITKVVTEANGNVGESRALKLGEHFTVMMLVALPQSDEVAVQEMFSPLKDMSISTFKTKDPLACNANVKIGYEGHFVLSGADHPGITHKVTALLAKHRFNIERLRTSDQEAPYGGTTLFHVEGIVNVLEPMPANFNIEAIRDELAVLGDSLNCDISLEDVADDELGYTVC